MAIDQAGNPAPPDKIEVNELFQALADAQGAFPVIPKDSEVIVYSKETPKRELYRYKYADLTTIISATRPALSSNGLSFTQGIVEGGFATTIMHSSGITLITGFIPLDLPKNSDMKTLAGIVTYVKRISLTAALGISADEDIDAAADEGALGNSTSKTPDKKLAGPKVNSPAGKESPPRPATALATPELMKEIADLAESKLIFTQDLDHLVQEGYGFKGNGAVPTWIAREILALLENEDVDQVAIMEQVQKVKARRELASRKAKI